MIYYISYEPGLSGDFLAFLLHQNEGFYKIDQNITDNNNRYWFPNLTEPFEYDFKLTKTPFTNEESAKLTSYYKSSIALPTHTYLPNNNIQDTIFIRLYTQDIHIIKISFILWWIKSHCTPVDPSLARKKEIFEIKNNYIREELINSFEMWKYVAYKHNFLKNDKFDLYYYIEKKYHHEIRYIRDIKYNNYNNLDINDLFYKNKLSSVCGVDIDQNRINNYVQNNYKIIDRTNINLNKDGWLNDLKEYIFKNLSPPIKLEL